MTVIVFDIGNVLIRWQPEAAIGHLFSDRAEMHDTLAKIDFFSWNLEQDRGRSWEEAVDIGRKSYPDYSQVFEAYVEGLAIAHQEPIEGSVKVLDELHLAGEHIYAITNASVKTWSYVQSMHPFASKFRDTVVSGAEGALKPGPEIFRIFLHRNNLDASQCVFIDDSAKNITGACTVGMDAIHFTGPADLRSELTQRGLL